MTTGKHSVEELASRIRKRPYSFISDNCLIKSVGLAMRCTERGVEAKVVACLALFHLGVPLAHFRVPIVGPHFYAEVLGKRYEVSREPDVEEPSRIVYNDEPKVLVRLVKFKFFIKE